MMLKKSHLAGILAVSACLLSAPSAHAAGQTDAERYAEAGQKALAEGQYTVARSNFEQLAKLDPSLAEVHATLAVIDFKLREYESTISEVRKAQRLKPGLPRLNSLLGLSLAELGQFADALPSLEKGFHYTPEPEVRRMCGLQLLRAYSGLGRYAEAVSAALELDKVFPNDPEVLYHTSHVYGNYAYVVMENLHEKAPDSIWMLQAQGEASESQREYDAAISTFNRVLVLDPNREGIHFKLGRIYLARFRQSRKPEDHDSAKREFLAELSGDPDNGNASYELAQMSADDNDFEQAIQRFEAVVARFPAFEQALVGLGGVYLHIKMGDKALTPLRTATKLDPRDEVAWYRLAQAERSGGNQDMAQKALDTYHTLHAVSTAGGRSLTADEVTPQQMSTDAQP